jgi:hypothetical protein
MEYAQGGSSSDRPAGVKKIIPICIKNNNFCRFIGESKRKDSQESSIGRNSKK